MDDYKQATNSDMRTVTNLTRQQVATWLGSATKFAATGDINFADDGETAVLPVPALGKPLKPAAVLILLVNQFSRWARGRR
jgi:hypothetical protein